MFSFGKPSKNKFARQLREAIVKLNGSTYRYDAHEFMLIGTENEQRINLANVYKEHCALDKPDRAVHLAKLASIFGLPNELPEDFDDAKASLRPKIWSRAQFEFMELHRQIEGGKALDMPLYPVGSHLVSTIVYDTPNAMRSLSNEELSNWGVTYYEGHEIACQNLEEATMAYAVMGDHFHSSMTGDNYDSSRVLLMDRIRGFDVIGDHIACVPNREAMYVTGSEDEQGLKIMFDLVNKTIQDGDLRPLSPLPMILVDGEWLDWQPPMDHPTRSVYEHLSLNFFGGLYADQKDLLEQLYADDPLAPFVATFSAMQNEETKELTSFCVWTQGILSLLPRTDKVFLGDADGGTQVIVSWEHLQMVVGDLIEADETFYPTRYRVREFPNADQIAELQRLSAN
ncbi:hypothetical protein [Stieleria varia]|uniref:DUF1444 family protein n=1 Tax=Stieleria varia TaxID=2528005 RepID=A0A5C6B8C5_9BACT|nr:hypothetical protein [Stieleria varia]TWU08210.1 hypothetical protein Pla52n_07920 [Stieleria varia]